MDYRSTLNLPQTDFPMRARLPRREPEFLNLWVSLGLYRRMRAARQGRKVFVLHDGPPYANGNIHIGTALNKILKDIVNRFAFFAGYDIPFVPGWDTHGLPIERQAIVELGIQDWRAVDPVELRNRCRDFALKYIDIMTAQFQRLGVLGDWEHPYVTLDPLYEAAQIRVFGEMARKGYFYKGLKPIYWCVDCETALAEAEVEYAEKKSHSIYVAFPVHDGRGLLPEDAFLVIWTTTPWTLPANTAVAVHPEFEYVLVGTNKGKMVMARELAASVLDRTGLEEHKVEKTFKGRELEGALCRHPFYERNSVVILGDHVTLGEGTGCVHTAPGHGREDFEIGERYGVQVVQPLDDRGFFTEAAPGLAGVFFEEANEQILDILREKGRLLAQDLVRHQYAHCWRCKNPLVWRATEQWFASIDEFREAALKAIDEVRWIPHAGRERIASMVADRSDWCISRQRVWGVPIPAFYCSGCGEPLMNDRTIEAVAELFAREGSNAWFEKAAGEILPAGMTCPACGGTGFHKESDTMDVWFDSGSSHAAVLEHRQELSWPADLYLEGSDQHRGWFQSSLLTGVATRGRAPYRAVLTHGFVVDGEGRKMSKSLGNVIRPEEVIEEYGADILRLWVAAADYRGDIRISGDILKQQVEVYRKIRNTFRFMLGNLGDFEPERDSVGPGSLEESDRWILSRLQKLLTKVTRAYEDFEYHVCCHAIHNFCTVDLSALYLDVVKDRLYILPAAALSRRAAQTALYLVSHSLVRLLAPILVFTAEEVWQHLPREEGDPESVHLAVWPEVRFDLADEELEERWSALLRIRDEVSRALEEARNRKLIGSSLEAELVLRPGDPQTSTLLEGLEGLLADLFIVSRVHILPHGSELEGEIIGERRVPGLDILVLEARGEKCERCWRFSEDTGADETYATLCPRCIEAVERATLPPKA